LELFEVTARGAYEEKHGTSFVEATREFAAWAEDLAVGSLAPGH